VGTDDPRVRLIDLATCGHSHTLVGHRDAVLTVAWCPLHEHVLASGSRDGTVRLWDVRRSGTTALLSVLDQGRTLPGAAAASAAQSAGAAAASVSGASSHPALGSAFGGGTAVAHSYGVTGLHFPPAVAQKPARPPGDRLAGAAWNGGARRQAVPSDRLAGLLLSSGVDGRIRCWQLNLSTPASEAGGGDGGGVSTEASLRAAAGSSSVAGGQLRGGIGTASDFAASASDGGGGEPGSAAVAGTGLLLTSAGVAAAAFNTLRHYPGLRPPALQRCVPMATADASGGALGAVAAVAGVSGGAVGSGSGLGAASSALLFHPSAGYAPGQPASRAATGDAVAAVGPAGSVAARAGVINVYDLYSGALLAELRGHHGAVAALAYCVSTQQLFTAGDDGLLLRWQPGLLRPGRTLVTTAAAAQESEWAVPSV
jgi:WD40 repeat protein